jgi:hypothetical protein
LVLVACLDEIFFHGRAVLVGVEPHTMVWFLGQKANSLTGSAWADRLQAWDALQDVVADAGRPLQAGIACVQEQRRQDNRDPLASSLDVFHTKYEARKALTIGWNQVERDGEAFDRAEAQVRKDQRHGINALPATMRARQAWKKLVQSFHRYEGIESAWKQAEVALGVFRPDGRLNDRTWAEAQVALALPGLVGRAWVTFATTLKTPRASPSWTACTVSWRGFLSSRNCARPSCDCGGCEGSARAVPSRGRSAALDTWRTWCNGNSARSWMPTG